MTPVTLTIKESPFCLEDNDKWSCATSDSDSDETQAVPQSQRLIMRADFAEERLKRAFTELQPDIVKELQQFGPTIEFLPHSVSLTYRPLLKHNILSVDEYVRSVLNASLPEEVEIGISYKEGIGHLLPFPQNWRPQPFTTPPEQGCSHAGKSFSNSPEMYGKQQDLYGKWFQAKVKEIASRISLDIKKDSFLHSILTDLGKARQEIATHLKQRDADHFGAFRMVWSLASYSTPLFGGFYDIYKHRLQCAFNMPFPWEQICTISWGDIDPNYQSASAEGNPIFYDVVTNQKIGVEDRAFIVRYPFPCQDRPSLLSIVTTTNQRQGEIFIIHTADLPKGNLKDILSSFEPLIRELLLKKNPTKEEVLQTLAKLHWYLAHWMPFERGSASINEILVQAIASAAGFPHSEWAKEILPDIEAILRYPDQFISDYPCFLNLEKQV